MRRRSALSLAAGLTLLASLLLWLGGSPAAREALDAMGGDEPGLAGAAGAGPAGEGRDGGASTTARARIEDAGILGGLPPWQPTASVSAAPDCPHGGLSGRVISAADGQGIAGVELVFDREGTTTDTVSGANGVFALCVSAEGRYVLAIASKPGFLPFAPEWGHSPIALVARPGQRVDGVVVQLSPTITATVEVVGPDDAPVEGASVELLGGGEGERAMAPLAASARTDEAGRTTLEAWAGALIEASLAARGRGRARVDGPEEVTRVVLGTVDGPAARASLAGRVVDPRGAPVEGAVVRAFLQRRGLHPSAQAASDADGAFVLEGLDEGPHFVTATHPDYRRGQRSGVPSGARDVVLQLEPGVAIEGRVVDGSGAPVPAFNVVARVAQGALVRRTVASVASYDPEGHFRLAGLAPGDYELVATSRGYPPSAPVAVTAREVGAPSVTLRLERGGRVEGRVTGEGGAPIEGARIALVSMLSRRTGPAPALVGAVSDVEGRFSLEGIGAGVSSLRVEAEGHHGRMVSAVRAAPGETVTVDVALTPLTDGERPRIELAGIGVSLFPRQDRAVIGRVMEGGSAHEAGLVPGDVVLAVDGASVTELGFEATLDRIRGAEGTAVRLTVLRRGAETASELTLVRRRVRA